MYKIYKYLAFTKLSANNLHKNINELQKTNEVVTHNNIILYTSNLVCYLI